ncbi:hypothetical protein [Streptomyces sp. CRN 30]|uniref:hypothetical protein n=1 Tax=Streptomyces sp. CRN 30 TaxID=3075613 RepID=UPI002A8367F8|nr:hypothetical protein [Streptomyces sp. CRN 30]
MNSTPHVRHAPGLGARCAPHLPAVSADHGAVTGFAGAWQRHTGATPGIRDTRLRLYRLGTLIPPEPLPAGRSRLLGEQDLDRTMSWCREFAEAVGENVTIDAASWSGTRFADKRYGAPRYPIRSRTLRHCVSPLLPLRFPHDCRVGLVP